MLCCRSLLSTNLRLLARFQQQHHRCLVTGTAKFGKLFQENENEHAFTVLESNAGPRSFPKSSALTEVENFGLSTLGLLNLTDVPIEKLHSCFVLITSSIKDSETTIEEPRFNSLIENIIIALPNMTFDQIVDIIIALKYWPSTGSIRSPNFCALWNALDYQCTSRCEKWTHGQLLEVAYLWFQLKFSRLTTYNSKMITLLGKDINILSSHTVVQLLFFINMQRNKMPASLATEIEKKLMEDMEHLTLDELGVAALGFFKTQTPLQSEKLLTAIIAKILLHSDEISEMTLAALLKLIRYSTTINVLQSCRELQDAFISRVNYLQPSTLTHLVLLVVQHLICHNELLIKVALRFSRDIHFVRLKELSKGLYCLAMFKSFSPLNHDISMTFASRIVEELRLPERLKEIEDYSVSFVSIILSLAYMNIFPEDLINMCLGKEFISITQQSSKDIDTSRELAVIDYSVGIECNWYKGSRLPSSTAIKIFKKLHFKTLSTSHQDRMMEDIRESTMDIFGISESNYFQICHILPHFQIPDVLFVLDESGCVKPIPVQARNPNGNIIRPTTRDKWFSVVGGGRSFYQRDHRQATGASEMKLRQLKQLGYNVVEVPWFIYTSLHKGMKEKYMKKKIFEHL